PYGEPPAKHSYKSRPKFSAAPAASASPAPAPEPAVPVSRAILSAEWERPVELPDWRRVDLMAFDSETDDRRLRDDKGSGWPFRQGHICGISIAARIGGDIHKCYLPIRHPDSDNFPAEQIYQ